MDYKEESLKQHLKFKGKIEIRSKFPEIKTKDDLAVMTVSVGFEKPLT